MSNNTAALDLDRNPSRWIAWNGVADEPTVDAALEKRELELRATARKVVAEHVAPRAAETDRLHTFAHDSYQALATAGLGGLIFPIDLGGTADTNVGYAVVMEEIAAACPATSLVFMTQMHAAYPISLAAPPAIAKRFVPPLLQGHHYGSLAITEPAAGSDAATLTTRAVRSLSGDQYTISGSKTFITTGDRADVLITFATIDVAAGRKGITAFIVDGDSAGVSRGRPFHKTGMHGSTTAEIFFDEVQVPAEHRLGAEGSGWSLLTDAVVKSRVSAAAQGVGIARAAYLRGLCALGLPVSPMSPFAETALADIRGRILQGRLLLHSVARRIDASEHVSTGLIGMMKQACTDLGWKVAVEVAGLLGTRGDDSGLGVERLVRDAKVTQIYDGTNEIQRLLISRETHAMVGAQT
ncbi:MAG TPA: acyl-CoA dehydrogenase family protein [Terrimesophilobacter sp.]|nr:acyl-CoA dehydrogenase family protein [Terrimesophilobacter sp.]